MSNRDSYSEIPIPSSHDFETAQGECCFLSEEGLFQGNQTREMRELALKMSRVSVPCLLMGESGTGKTFLAKYIHRHSPRAQKPFVVVSCPSIPRELFETELFGHVKGAFSGATSNRRGLFAQAEGGTLLLDEISELPLPMQAKLLHVLQEKEYRPVGGDKMIPADVRVLAATNRDISHMVEHQLFRQDLFFRLNIFDITLPPLRERTKELPEFIKYFLRISCRTYGRHLDISGETMAMLLRYHWPGNIRELRNIMERMVILAEDGLLEPRHLPPSFFASSIQDCPQQGGKETSARIGLRPRHIGRDLLIATWQEQGSSRRVACALGISQSSASRLIRRYVTGTGRGNKN